MSVRLGCRNKISPLGYFANIVRMRPPAEDGEHAFFASRA